MASSMVVAPHCLANRHLELFFVLTYSFIVTLIIGFAIDKTIGLRVKEEAEISGIDYDQHAETGYELTNSSRGGFSS